MPKRRSKPTRPPEHRWRKSARTPHPDVRWGHLKEIKGIRTVPGKTFDGRELRLRHLASWRRMHAIRTHAAVRAYARRNGVKPSSDLSLAKKVAFVVKRTRKK